jgi:hypothetical protein
MSITATIVPPDSHGLNPLEYVVQELWRSTPTTEMQMSYDYSSSTIPMFFPDI